MKKKQPFLVVVVCFFLPLMSASNNLEQHSFVSLSPPHDTLVSSPLALFTLGFYPVGDNAYCLGIWLTQTCTLVWMANRDNPVNSRNTKLSLSSSGNLVLTDADQIVVWKTDTVSKSPTQLNLHDNGNLVLQPKHSVHPIWQSFDSPTNTLLPHQLPTRDTVLVSSASRTNYSSGFYKLRFDADNVLRLSYNGELTTSVFWPFPWLNSWEAGRTTYNDSKIAELDLKGGFISSDDFKFRTSDYGLGPLRRFTLDHDGNARVYSLDTSKGIWSVTWQLTLEPCNTHGICGANALCTYTPASGPACSCLPGYKMANVMDASQGCIPDFIMPCNDTNSTHFLQLSHVEFYGYDIGYFQNYTLDKCKNLCLSYCSCKGFQYKYEPDTRFYSCFPKTLLFNGYQSVGFAYWMYLKYPKSIGKTDQQSHIRCNRNASTTMLSRPYEKRHEHGWIKSLLWSTIVVGAFEIICLLIFLCMTRWPVGGATGQRYHQVVNGFKRFSYAELKKASNNFREEIGRGGSGIIYKAVLADNRVAAIKCLYDAKQGEAEFLGEVNLIGRMNHANLTEWLGFCAEGKHRILVYEYVVHGSLAQNLHSGNLDWEKRLYIALGTAKGLAYLHEECLEWVLHCDVKPHNILLDANYHPKVADFGLSKLLKRDSMEESNMSRIRGTRGYMAPEWVFHLPITSKVDVYSYGVVVLEMVTGRSPSYGGGVEEKGLVRWVREIVEESETSLSWVEQVVDNNVSGEYKVEDLETLVKVALQCTRENQDARPTMGQVLDMLLH